MPRQTRMRQRTLHQKKKFITRKKKKKDIDQRQVEENQIILNLNRDTSKNKRGGFN